MKTTKVSNDRLRQQYEEEGLMECIMPFENWVNYEVSEYNRCGRHAVRTEEGIEITDNN